MLPRSSRTIYGRYTENAALNTHAVLYDALALSRIDRGSIAPAIRLCTRANHGPPTRRGGGGGGI